MPIIWVRGPNIILSPNCFLIANKSFLGVVLGFVCFCSQKLDSDLGKLSLYLVAVNVSDNDGKFVGKVRSAAFQHFFFDFGCVHHAEIRP